MLAQGVVVDPSTGGVTDGTTTQANFGRSNDLLMSEVHGKFYTQTYRGNAYWGATALAGVTLSIVTATTFVGLVFWNGTPRSWRCGTGTNLPTG